MQLDSIRPLSLISTAKTLVHAIAKQKQQQQEQQL